MTITEAPAKRWCYYIPAGQAGEQGYVPSVVVEGEAGHSPLTGRGELSEPWYWGADYETAKETCRKANAERGLSERDVLEIVTSSMAAQGRRQRHELESRAKLGDRDAQIQLRRDR